MIKRFFLSALLCPAIALSSVAQRNTISSPNIASLQVVAGNDWQELPVVRLGEGQPIIISFDDLTHEYHRYSYKLEHCEADWSVSKDLFESDFCAGFANGNTIDDFHESVGTNQFYTHYRLQIPNDRCRPKMSGNYKLTVYDEQNDDAEVLTACFMIVQPMMKVDLHLTSQTDLDINGRYQQLEMRVNYNGIRPTSPADQIVTVVMQNGSWHDAVIHAKPQYISGDGMIWSHNRSLIFNGGNEYRKFEMLDVTHPTMGLEEMSWDGTCYNAYIWPDEPRPSYVYDEDANGTFYIRNSDNTENDTQSEYVMAHFTLKSPRLPEKVYLNGTWTNDWFTAPYQMQWNEEQQQYEAALWLKQGYYNYRYLVQRADGTTTLVPSEGNFYQTHNKYQVLIYYKGNGDRADRLVGYATLAR